MSCQPTSKTHDLAHEYLHRLPPTVVDKDRQLYDEIMEEPFDGDHWGDGYDSEVKEGWTDSESERGLASDTDSGGPEEAIITPHRQRPSGLNINHHDAGDFNREERLREAEEALLRLQKDAYWSTGGEVVEAITVKEGWKSVSTGMSVAALAFALETEMHMTAKVRLFSIGLDGTDMARLSPGYSSSENCCLPSRVDRESCSISKKIRPVL